MVYINLATPVRDFDKVRVKEVSFFDTNGESNLDKALSFKYQVYKKDEDKYISFYDRHINITNQAFIDSVVNIQSGNLSAYDAICKKLLQYLVDNSLETGTIEIEWTRLVQNKQIVPNWFIIL